MPAVSVILPAYNQATYLGQAVQSVLNQSYIDFELIVIDDGSTDHTKQVACSFNDPRLRYIYQDNQGLSAARNTGIRESKGPYLTYLDSDDLFLPAKLAHLCQVLDERPEIGFVAGQAVPIDEQGNPIGKIFNKPLPEDRRQLLLGNPLHVGSVMLRRSWQEKVGFFDTGLRSYEDWDMWLRLVKAGCPMDWIARPVSLYRFHGAQMTRQGAQMTEATFAVLDKIFSDPSLPSSWRQYHDRAYSNAYLRAAAQAYSAQDYANAKAYLLEAVALNPDLQSDDGSQLASLFSAWTDLPKTRDALVYLENIYNNLPEQLPNMARRRSKDLGTAARRIVYQTYEHGESSDTLRALGRALKYQPAWITEHGTLSILARSMRNLLFRN